MWITIMLSDFGQVIRSYGTFESQEEANRVAGRLQLHGYDTMVCLLQSKCEYD